MHGNLSQKLRFKCFSSIRLYAVFHGRRPFWSSLSLKLIRCVKNKEKLSGIMCCSQKASVQILFHTFSALVCFFVSKWKKKCKVALGWETLVTLISLINVALRLFFWGKYFRPYAVIKDPSFIYFLKKIIEKLSKNFALQKFLALR